MWPASTVSSIIHSQLEFISVWMTWSVIHVASPSHPPPQVPISVHCFSCTWLCERDYQTYDGSLQAEQRRKTKYSQPLQSNRANQRHELKSQFLYASCFTFTKYRRPSCKKRDTTCFSPTWTSWTCSPIAALAEERCSARAWSMPRHRQYQSLAKSKSSPRQVFVFSGWVLREVASEVI